MTPELRELIELEAKLHEARCAHEYDFQHAPAELKVELQKGIRLIDRAILELLHARKGARNGN